MIAGLGWGKGGLEAGVGPVVGQQQGLKETTPFLTCIHQLTGLSIWGLRARSDQRTPGAGSLAQHCSWDGGVESQLRIFWP